MGLYRFHFHADVEGSPSIHEADYANDGAAAETAFATLRGQPAFNAVEVYLGGRLITRIERPDPAFLNARSGLHGLR